VDGVQKVVTVKSIEDIAGVIPDRTIDSLVKAMQPSSSGLTYENISKVVTDMVADGWSASQVVTQVCIPLGCAFRRHLLTTDTALPDYHLQRIYRGYPQEQNSHDLLRDRQASRGWRRRAPVHPRHGITDSRRTDK
jgi:hypothetical protein